jgi:3-phenylpropionate/cinnamic acid dioxygenase small subunit
MDLKALFDRAGAADVVVAYAAALDAHDWAGFAALFEDMVEIDYGSAGMTVGRFAARAWADRCRMLEMFDATHHKVSNLKVELSGETAIVRSHIDAAHFITVDGRVLEAFLLGHYEHHLVRRDADWRIALCRLTVAGYPGGRDRFDAAFAAARAKFTG